MESTKGILNMDWLNGPVAGGDLGLGGNYSLAVGTHSDS